MKINRTKNAGRNIVAGLINKTVLLLLPFIVRTVFIYSLGSEYLGLNSLFSSILSVLNVTELGFSSAIVFSMYGPIANDDRDAMCALLNYYKKIYRIVGTVILAGGLLILPFLPKLIKGSCPDELNIYVLYFLYLLNTALSYFLFAYKKSILEAFQRRDVIALNETITSGLTNVLQLVILLVWKSLYAYYLYVLTMLVLTVVNNFLNSNKADRMFPDYECRGDILVETRAGIKKQVSGLMVSKVCQMTRNSLDSIFVSAFIGLQMTAIYNNYYYIIQSLIGIMNVVTNAMLAGVGNSIVSETQEKNHTDFTVFNFIYMWISSWSTVTLFVLYQNFMYLWVGSDLVLPTFAAVLFSTYYYTLKIGDIRAMYSSAAGLWWENRNRSIVEMIANVLLNYLMVRKFGIYGIVGATVLPLVFINFTFSAQILYKYYFTEFSIWGYFIDNLAYAIVTLIAAFATWRLCETVIGGYTLINLILRGFVCCLLPNLIFVICYCKTKKYKMAVRWVRKKIRGIWQCH